MSTNAPTSPTSPAKPVIAITLGDAAGIGPEVTQMALESPEIQALRCTLKVIGTAPPGTIPGRPTPPSAKAALDALETATTLALQNKVQAIVTAPISKYHLANAGFHFPGQTEFFAQRAGVSDFAMILTGASLTVGLATIHIPIRQIPQELTQDAIIQAGQHLVNFQYSRFPDRIPRIAVAGLNPHAGESGRIGQEETTLILPAIEKLQKNFSTRAQFSGPHSPDTIFFHAAQGDYDAVLCMYHDQGLIPLKLLAFHSGVNVTSGLPFVRTSPDHGTAFSLAGTHTANPGSMIAAITLAHQLLLTKK